MGIAPQNWGPHVWAAIHLICLGAPERFSSGDSAAYRLFFENLANVLPCEVCRTHLRQNLTEVPLDTALTSGRDALFTWSVKLNNKVNEMLGKPVVRVEDAFAYWHSIARGGKVSCHANPIIEVAQDSWNACAKNTVLLAIMLIIGVLLGMFFRY